MNIPPWLSHLPADRRGIPVPYINRWGLENDINKLTVAVDPWIGRRAVFYDDSADTVPDFTSQHQARQRECFARGLCQVCARPVPWSRRFLVVSDISLRHGLLHGQPAATLIEPWLDARCLDFALTTCPALIRRRRDEEITVLPVTSAREVALGVTLGWLDGPLEAETRADPVVLWSDVTVPSSALQRAVTHTPSPARSTA